MPSREDHYDACPNCGSRKRVAAMHCRPCAQRTSREGFREVGCRTPGCPQRGQIGHARCLPEDGWLEAVWLERTDYCGALIGSVHESRTSDSEGRCQACMEHVERQQTERRIA